MTGDNLRVVKDIFTAFARSDVNFIIESLTADVEWEAIGDRAIASHYGLRTGPVQVTEYFMALGRENDFVVFQPETFDVSEDKVFVTGRSGIRKRSGGKTFSERWIQVFTLREGKVCGFLAWDSSAGHLQAGR